MTRLFALLIALGHPLPGLADEIGRLFFSPTERQALDRDTGDGEITRPNWQRLDGQILREGQRRQLWIDGQLRDAPSAPAFLAPGDRFVVSPGRQHPLLGDGNRIEIHPWGPRR